MEKIWQPGLGSYLQALGLMRAASEIDPSVRAYWQADTFHLDHDSDTTRKYLLDTWRGRYRMWWVDKITSSQDVLRLRARCTDEEVAILDAHVTVTNDGELTINPLFGALGKSRNASFGGAADQARAAINEANATTCGAYLDVALGEKRDVRLPVIMLQHWFWPAGTPISPYSMLLVLEGALMFRPSTLRTLAVDRTRANGTVSGPGGLEIIAPTWTQPLSLAELEYGLADYARAHTLIGVMLEASSGEMPSWVSGFSRFRLARSGAHADRWMCSS